MLSMQHAAFTQPLTDAELQELGRLVVNCVFVEFLFDIHAGMTFQLDGLARRKLIAPMATRKKIEIIEAHIPDIPQVASRQLVEEAVKLINPTIRARNYLLHGIWGMDGPQENAKPIVISPKDDQGHKSPEDITGVADSLAVASEKLAVALVEDGGGTATIPDRLVIQLSK
jgi:hypothetical protein